MKRTYLKVLFLLSLFVSSCTDGTKKYLGSHTINVPLYVKNYDFSKKTYLFGLQTSPEVHYLEIYTSKIEFYRTEDGKLSGKFTFTHPENDRSQIYAHKIKN